MDPSCEELIERTYALGYGVSQDVRTHQFRIEETDGLQVLPFTLFDYENYLREEEGQARRVTFFSLVRDILFRIRWEKARWFG